MKRIGIMLFQLLVTAAGLWYIFHHPQKRPDTPYSGLIESDVVIVVQHRRLDSRQVENAFLTTIAFPCD
jgi:hypothetical protein